MADRYEQIDRLKELLDKDAISFDEYQQEKARILSDSYDGSEAVFSSTEKYWGMDLQTFNMAMHLSQLANFAMPLAGVILPCIMWSSEKDKHPEIDRQGRMVVNWVITSILYFAISFVLCFFLIGIPLIIIVGILDVVFPVIGGMKAKDGHLWKYPMTIRFV